MSNKTWHSLDEAGRQRWRRERKRREYEARIGNPRSVDDVRAEKVREKVRAFRARGMNLVQMQEQTGIHLSTISEQLRPGKVSMNRRTYQALAAMAFEEPSPTARLDATGSQRRVLSLWHDGFGPQFVASRVTWPKSGVQRLARGELSQVEARTARMFRELYEELEGKTPADFGIPDRSARYVRTFALKHGGVPRYCWEEWTIDDPDAIPDWTGYCGTGLGMKIHKREGIPVCGPCKEAYVPGNPYPGFDGEKLRELRERAWLSREELGRRSGLDGSTIQYWETNRSRPYRGDLLDRVLHALDATYEDVCDPVEGT